MEKLTIKHLFLLCSIACFVKNSIHSNYLDVILCITFVSCYFLEQFRAYQILATQNNKEMSEMRLDLARTRDNQKILGDRINELRSANGIVKALRG